ncbi:DUF1588 domain-containing protein [Prosthecobacter sp.]|uniref:DUF1588 domain-containing protein n=1 Tax=Prosthecobacter sp. TaxID=1965333 RepID=UPI002AB88588|nr:DUF1588 domain-containing protein [Prosthecobacter sp.]MDZ4401730.1 DUF1588 domain-containing protein [Prosthecobacter sp.]
MSRLLSHIGLAGKRLGVKDGKALLNLLPPIFYQQKVRLLSVSLLVCPLFSSSAAEPPHAQLDEKHRAFFKDYCVECHNAEKQKGKLRLDDISFAIESVENADRWQKILNQLNSGEMPPEDEKQPEASAKTEFLDALAGTMVTARKGIGDQGGQIVMRRLNRREYKNTIRDLLGVEIDVRDLPADGGTGGFDTVGASLFMSGDQIEQYLALGRRALDEHFERSSSLVAKQPLKARTEAEKMGNQRMDGLFKRTQEQHDNYVRWTTEVDAAAKRPENVAIAEKLRKDAEKPRPSSGVPYATPMLFYHGWDQISGAPSPVKFGFQDAQAAFFEELQYKGHFDYYADYQKLPGRDTGAWLLFYQAYRETYVEADAKWPAGRYTLRMRVAANETVPKERRFIEVGQRGEDVSAFTVLSAHQITGTLTQPQVIELNVEVNTQGKREFALRERRPNSREAEIRSYYDAKEKTGKAPVPAIWIDWVEIEGPVSATPAVAQEPFRARTEAEVLGNQRMNNNLKRLKEGHEQYARWMAAVEAAAKLPENVKLAAELRESTKIPSMNPFDGRRVGLLFNNKWEVIKGAPAPQTFGLGDAETARVQELEHIYQFQYFTDYMKLPARDTGAWLGFYFAYRETYVAADAKWPPGRYTLRMRVSANEAAPKERRFIEIGQRTPDPKDVTTFTVVSAHQVTGTLNEPQIIELDVNVSADGFREFALREKRPNSRTAEMGLFHDHFAKTGTGPVPAVWVDWFEIEGPHEAPRVVTSFVPRTQDRAGVSEVIERFATRAFRGQKPDAEYIDKLLLLAVTRGKAGDSLEDALKESFSVVLSSPGFLYLQETGSPSFTRNLLPKEEAGKRLGIKDENRKALTPLELASRLSYFLWSAPPDDELLKADLTNPQVLAAQVDRMIASKKADEFVSGFAHQWLGLDRLDFFQFDFRKHRAFDDSAKAHAREEVYQTLATLLRENLSLRCLLKSDFVVINGLLADYYGLDGITGDEFRKVSLPAGSPRGGLLGMAAILAMGSNGDHTSPVERGAWVLRKLLHDPPPPAPPNVPQLDRLKGKVLTVRERMTAHQEEPQCASCHRKIDPIGFGLENFDAAGKWRIEDSYQLGTGPKKTWPVNPAAAFHHGPAFKDYFELRDLITAKSDQFARGFTEALIEYALGRPFGFTDEDLAVRVVQQAQQKDFALREFIHALVASDTFHMK